MLRLRAEWRNAKPRPAKPSNIIAQVEGSGTAPTPGPVTLTSSRPIMKEGVACPAAMLIVVDVEVAVKTPDYLAIRRQMLVIGQKSADCHRGAATLLASTSKPIPLKILSRENRECVLLTNKRRDGLVQYSMRRSITNSRQIDDARGTRARDKGDPTVEPMCRDRL